MWRACWASTRSFGGVLLLGTLVFCFLAVDQVAAHGSLLVPKARNWLAKITNNGPPWWDTSFSARVNGAENFGNGHGPALVKPAAGPGVCGDPWQHYSSNYAGMSNLAIQATYATGSTISVQWLISANHGGRIGLKLCNRRTNLNQACFDANPLQRADGRGRFYYIMSGTVSGNMAVWYGTMQGQFRLPAGVSCPNGCVLQWEYLTMNSCFPSDISSCQDCGVYAQRRNPVTGAVNMANCCLGAGCSAAVVPEVFYNCADVAITSSGGGPSTPPPSTPPPSTPPPSTPPGCVDTHGACPGWVGQCAVPGVATTCPCMCRNGGPAPPPGPGPAPPPGCTDTHAACPGWVGQCAVPGVATTCPCMCGVRRAAATTSGGTRASKRSNRKQRMGPSVNAAGTAANSTGDPLPEVVAAAAAAPVEVPANLPAEAYGVVLDEAVPVDFNQPAVAPLHADSIDTLSSP